MEPPPLTTSKPKKSLFARQFESHTLDYFGVELMQGGLGTPPSIPKDEVNPISVARVGGAQGEEDGGLCEWEVPMGRRIVGCVSGRGAECGRCHGEEDGGLCEWEGCRVWEVHMGRRMVGCVSGRGVGGAHGEEDGGLCEGCRVWEVHMGRRMVGCVSGRGVGGAHGGRMVCCVTGVQGVGGAHGGERGAGCGLH